MDIKDVENLAALARIELTEDEKKEILSDMKGILEYVKQIERPGPEVEGIKSFREAIQNGSAAGAKATSGTGTYNVWREDVLELREFSKELILGQFPDSQDGFLKVKKIL